MITNFQNPITLVAHTALPVSVAILDLKNELPAFFAPEMLIEDAGRSDIMYITCEAWDAEEIRDIVEEIIDNVWEEDIV